jgi:hypothetical protein
MGTDHAEWRGSTGQRVEDVENTVEDHENRITKLERFKYIMIGGLLVLSIVSGAGGVGSLVSILAGV